MSEQATFDFRPVSPVAANADPDTSHAAARQVTKDGTRKRQALAVLAAVQRWPSRTSAELARMAGLDRHLVARRLPELADARNGALVDRGVARRCNVTGKLALTWEPTKRGE